MLTTNGIKNFFIRNFWLLAVLGLSLLPLVPLTHPGMFTAHDSRDHVARIASFYQNLTEGTLVPRWAGNLNWGFGHPILMFLYPLPSYIASLFKFVGLSFEGATKAVFAVGFMGSGISMFVWINKLWGQRSAAVSSVLYMFAPYRFVDLYVRGAIGENFFFIFPPLACYFLVLLSQNKTRIGTAGVAFSIAGMVLSHNALTLMFLPFIAVYMLILFFNTSKQSIFQLLNYSVSILLGFCLSSFFLFPAFFEGKYTLRDIVTKNEIFTRFEPFSRLLHSPWNFGGTGQFSVSIGFLQWWIIAAAPFLMYYLYQKIKRSKGQRIKTKHRSELYLLITSFIFFWIAVSMMLEVSKPVYISISTLQKFQFPWRWLSLALFPPAIVGGFFITILPKLFKTISTIAITAISIFLTLPFWQPAGYFSNPDSFYSSTYEGTTDTGESAPVWSVRFMEKQPEAFSQIVEGNSTISLVSRTVRKHEYKVTATTGPIRFLENTLYFPGWFAYIDGRKVSLDDIHFQDPEYRGLINFYIPQGDHLITIQLEETKLRILSNAISAISGIMLLGYLAIPYLKQLSIVYAKK